MRNKILLYLFIFSLLFTIFIYVNDKRILDDLQEDLRVSQLAREELQAANKTLLEENEKLIYFSLRENEEAISYFEEQGVSAREVEARIEEELIGRNSSNDNELVPFAGMAGPMRFNRISILNHKWVIADFTDGRHWGEVLLSYTVDPKGALEFTTEKAFLYPVVD